MSIAEIAVATAGRRHTLDLDRMPENPWPKLPHELRGRVRDCDSHLILPPEVTYDILGPELGEPMRRKRQMQYRMLDGVGPLPRDGAAVWGLKGTMCHGAHDACERLEILDEMGVDQQLVFGSGMASIFWSEPEVAYPAAERFNRFAADWAAADPDRLRPAAVVPCRTPARAFALAKQAVELGLKAVQLAFYPDFEPEPSSEEWESLWSLLSSSGVPALIHWDMRWALIERAGQATKLHLRSGQRLEESDGAASTEALARQLSSHDRQGAFDDFAVMTVHKTPEQFLSSLALGGVFRRYPELRVGVFECTSYWVAPWLERLDALELVLTGSPSDGVRLSDQVRRSLRITPLYGEQFGQQLRTCGLDDVFVFGTDVPHPEGGVQPLQEVFGQLGHEPGDDLERVLVHNAEELFPAG
jgi:predicted TIM-barrel fold metal-dependent hydrolase